MNINEIKELLAEGIELDGTVTVNGKEATFTGLTFDKKDGKRVARLQFATPKVARAKKPEVTAQGRKVARA